MKTQGACWLFVLIYNRLNLNALSSVDLFVCQKWMCVQNCINRKKLTISPSTNNSKLEIEAVLYKKVI